MGVQRRVATEAEAKALASGVRLRILRLCLDDALTNKEIAGRLDANPATTLHHVRTLVGTGFLAPQPARRGARGSREVPYRATGKSWILNVEQQHAARGAHAMLEAFLDEYRLVEVPEQAQMVRMGLRLTDAEAEELERRMAELLEDFRTRPQSPDGRPYSLFLVVHPDVGRDVRPPAAS